MNEDWVKFSPTYLLYSPRNKPSNNVRVGFIVLNDSASPKMVIEINFNFLKVLELFECRCLDAGLNFESNFSAIIFSKTFNGNLFWQKNFLKLSSSFKIQSYTNIDNHTKNHIYVKFPFINHTMKKAMKFKLIVLINKFYPQVNSNIVFSKNTIQNFFKFKDIIPVVVKSNVVYRFICTHCSASYVGVTTSHF